MKMNRFYHAMTAIDNSVVTCGGVADFDDDIPLSTCEKFENGLWRDMEPLPIPLAYHCLVTINDTTILSIGGSTDEYGVRNKKDKGHYRLINNQRLISLIYSNLNNNFLFVFQLLGNKPGV